MQSIRLKYENAKSKKLSLQRNRQNKVHANLPEVLSDNSNKLLTSKLQGFIQFQNEVFVTDES